MDVPTVFYYCLPSKYFKKLIFLVIVGVKLVSLSPNWNLKYFRMFIYKKTPSYFKCIDLSFFTWPFSSRCDYIILYSSYKIEREFVVNTFNTLFGNANGGFSFIYIHKQSNTLYIVGEVSFCFMKYFKEILVQSGILSSVCLITCIHSLWAWILLHVLFRFAWRTYSWTICSNN